MDNQTEKFPVPTLTIRGVKLYAGLLEPAARAALISDIQSIFTSAPPIVPLTPWGKPMSVGMTSAGRVGWTSKKSGYFYTDRQANGDNWPDIPASILAIWQRVSDSIRLPDCCLINVYRDGSNMGLHQDRDEVDFSEPVVSVSLGDDGLFRIGNLTRGGSTQSVWLSSGDVVVMGGDARLLYHGIDRIRPGSSQLVPGGGRINLTLRVAR